MPFQYRETSVCVITVIQHFWNTCLYFIKSVYFKCIDSVISILCIHSLHPTITCSNTEGRVWIWWLWHKIWHFKERLFYMSFQTALWMFILNGWCQSPEGVPLIRRMCVCIIWLSNKVKLAAKVHEQVPHCKNTLLRVKVPFWKC